MSKRDRDETHATRKHCTSGISLCCRRATGSNADRDRGADTVLELSFGVPDHFVHIFGVIENENTAPTARVHIRRGTFPFASTRMQTNDFIGYVTTAGQQLRFILGTNDNLTSDRGGAVLAGALPPK